MISTGSFNRHIWRSRPAFGRMPPAPDVRIHEYPAEALGSVLAALVVKEGPVDYVITGPCTNFARLCGALGADAAQHIRRVTIMGGALHAPGNSGPLDPVTGDAFAEFNFYCDPCAVNVVLQSGIPVRIVPWDVTRMMTINAATASKLQPVGRTGSFVKDLMAGFLGGYGVEHDREFELNDPVAVMAATLDAPFRSARIHVVESSEQYGRSIESADGHPCQVFVLEQETRSRLIAELLPLLSVTDAR